jgi:hypothetical protein
MTIRRTLSGLALLLSLPALAGSASQQTPATTLTMTLYLANGKQPMANAPVTVYYLPFNPSLKYKLQIMAETTTNNSGEFTTPINTVVVPKTGLADAGAGPGEFNSEVVAVAPSRQIVVSPQILQLGHTVTTAAAAIVDPDTGKAELAAEMQAIPQHLADTAVQIGTSYRYIPVLALNSSPGMRVAFSYTFDTSTTKQTLAGAAISVNSENTGFDPFSVSGSTIESSDRQFQRHVYESGAYHRIIWANYKWVEDQATECTGVHQPCTITDKWTLDHWQGSIGQFNPNFECVKRGHKNRHHVRVCLKHAQIRVVSYKVPGFTYCGGNCTLQLTKNHPDATRDSVNSQEYDFQLAVAGFLGLDAQAAYGTITSVTWHWQKHGCSAPKSRVLWGHDSDPVDAPVVQASCIRLP